MHTTDGSFAGSLALPAHCAVTGRLSASTPGASFTIFDHARQEELSGSTPTSTGPYDATKPVDREDLVGLISIAVPAKAVPRAT